jgi:hypothetical protein
VSAVDVRGALAIHPGALGDVLLAIPALRALRKASGTVGLAAQRHIAALVVALGEADVAHDFETLRLDALFTDAGRAALPAADRLVCWFGARDATFMRRLRSEMPSAVVVPSVGPGLVWQHLLRTSGVDGGQWCGVVRVDEPLVAAGRAALRGAGWDGSRRVAIIQPGAGSVHKRWPAEAFASALEELGDLTLVLHEGPADAAAVAELSARVPRALRLGRPSLPTLAGALSLGSLYVGNDSGVSHLAAAVGTPAVVLFTEANLAWRPWASQPEALTITPSRVDPTDVAAVRAAIRRRLA